MNFDRFKYFRPEHWVLRTTHGQIPGLESSVQMKDIRKPWFCCFFSQSDDGVLSYLSELFIVRKI